MLLLNKIIFHLYSHRSHNKSLGDVQLQKNWGQIRQSLNQKCLDSKRKLKSDENVTES